MAANPVRVLIVDDSVVVRQVISDALRGDPGIEVVAVAPNGRVALEKIPECKPDILTLDLEMPEMDGLTFLGELRKRHSRLPVIVFSTLTERGAKAALEALARGATDCVCKPSGQRSVQATMERIRSELIPKIHGLVRRPGALPRPPLGLPAQLPAGSLPSARTTMQGSPLPAQTARTTMQGGRPTMQGSPIPSRSSMQGSGGTQGMPSDRIDAVVIGVSTGGPTALAEVIPHLPRDFPVPVFIVQHMPPVFTQVLASRLASSSQMKVREATNRERIDPGVVYIAPGDYHMRVAGSPREGWITLDQSPSENGCRPAVDCLFVSASSVYGRNLLSVILTGVGHDGTKGAQQIRRAGGTVWAQDEATSTAWGMPSSVIEGGLAQRVLPLPLVPKAVAEAVFAGRAAAAGSRRIP